MKKRTFIYVILVLFLLLIWVELAVGILGTRWVGS